MAVVAVGSVRLGRGDHDRRQPGHALAGHQSALVRRGRPGRGDDRRGRWFGRCTGPGEPGRGGPARAGPELVFEHCQELADGTPALCAPPPERARSALAMASGLLARLGELGADTFLDCGRIDGTAPSPDLFERADLAVLVARPRLADLNSLAAYLEARATPDHRPPVLVLVGPGPYATAEVSAALGLQVVSHLPWAPPKPRCSP